MKQLFISLLVFMTLSLALAQSPKVLAAESILLEPISISELTSTSATLNLNTSLDVACLVVFGTDTDFGNMALDSDMGASAHQNHSVIMRGLEPDTDYVYRLQGSDNFGNLYASAVMSFRTPVAAAGPDLGTNVASTTLGASVVDVSSNYGGGANSSSWGANNAIDGQATTEWSSAGDGNNAFITIDLVAKTQVSGFGLWTRTMGTSAEISSFEVENEVGDIYGPFEVDNANGIFDFPIEAEGQSFTFRVTGSNGGNTGVVEVAIYSKQ